MSCKRNIKDEALGGCLLILSNDVSLKEFSDYVWLIDYLREKFKKRYKISKLESISQYENRCQLKKD